MNLWTPRPSSSSTSASSWSMLVLVTVVMNLNADLRTFLSETFDIADNLLSAHAAAEAFLNLWVGGIHRNRQARQSGIVHFLVIVKVKQNAIGLEYEFNGRLGRGMG